MAGKTKGQIQKETLNKRVFLLLFVVIISIIPLTWGYSDISGWVFASLGFIVAWFDPHISLNVSRNAFIGSLVTLSIGLICTFIIFPLSRGYLISKLNSYISNHPNLCQATQKK